MAKTATASAPAEAKKEDKPKRRVLTDEERVKQLEAQLEAARKKAADKSRAKVNDLTSRRQLLVQQVVERVAKIREIEAELVTLSAAVTPFEVTAPAVDTDGEPVKG